MIAYDENDMPILCPSAWALLTAALIAENVRDYNKRREDKEKAGLVKTAKCKVCRGKPDAYGCDGCRYHG